MVIYGEDLEIDKMQWRELDVRLEKMNYKEPLSKEEKIEAVLMGIIVALLYLFALGIFIDGQYLS